MDKISSGLQPVAISTVPPRPRYRSPDLAQCWAPSLTQESIRLLRKRTETAGGCTRFRSLQSDSAESFDSAQSLLAFSFGLRAILGCEGTPSKADGQDCEMAKESATNNAVSGTVELETKTAQQNQQLTASFFRTCLQTDYPLARSVAFEAFTSHRSRVTGHVLVRPLFS